MYQLATGSPGYGQGVRIANFNDGAAAPDVGAAQSGTAAMKFGIAAASSGSSAGGTSTGTTGVTPPPTAAPATPSVPSAVPSTAGSSPQVAPAASGTGSGSAKLGMDSSSYTSAAGDSVTFSAILSGSSSAPTGTIVFRDNGAPIAGCNAIALAGGTATCTTNALAGGSHAISGMYSGDSVYSAGIAGPITQTVTGSVATSAPLETALNVQGMWWGSSAESGWGLQLTQQGGVVFATWFTYDAAGNPQWFAMSNGAKSANGSYSGSLYRATGPAYNTAGFDPARVAVGSAGSASLTFSDANHGTFTATVDGVTVTKAITRNVFGAQLPSCVVGGDPAAATNYQDLWWRAGGTEPGWGLTVAHQGNVLFVTWYTYDENGRGTWFVASNATRSSDGSYSGTLYRATGPAFNSAAWDPSRVSLVPVGSMGLAFTDGASGVFSYDVNGVAGSKPITRDLFATPPTVCS
jgi:hypothetical protein